MPTLNDVRWQRAELVRRVQPLGDVADIFAEASARLRHLVPFDASAWVATDPATGLAVAPSRIENIADGQPEYCLRYWQREYLVYDVNLFRDLTRARVPAAGLRATTTDPEPSPRFREFVRPLGFDDELRIVLRVGDTPWADVCLYRRDGEEPFNEQDVALVASLSAPLGDVLRSRALGCDAVDDHPTDGPGLLLFASGGALISANEAARAWLADLPPDPGLPSELGLRIPTWILATVFRARALAVARIDGTARARMRTRGGRWVVCHGSCMRDTGGAFHTIVVVIEPATTTDIAPIVVQAHGLTEREQQITGLICRGASTADIAAELFLSTHTVRDYVKAIFRKVDVSSRGELVARLFTEHYWPVHQADIARAFGRSSGPGAEMGR